MSDPVEYLNYLDANCNCAASRREKHIETFYKTWKPTPENINALPEPVQRYIHDLETICDPAGMIAEIAALKDERDALVIRNAEILKAFRDHIEAKPFSNLILDIREK